jgi:hypothetical protein
MRSHAAIVGFVARASETDAYPPFGIAWGTKFCPGSNVRHSARVMPVKLRREHQELLAAKQRSALSGLPCIREGGRSKGKPTPWAEMILICQKRFLAPVATVLVIMRVVSNTNSITTAECCAAPVQLLEPRIELRLIEINIIHPPRRRSDAIHLQRVERITDLSY